MSPIVKSTKDYESWLKKEVGPDFFEHDLKDKHEAMRENPFRFLRATYWRWAEIILDICPEMKTPEVLAIGDIHLENFGAWRDSEGRLAWGVNDFDEAAIMPYALDLLRLAASAILARGKRELTPSEICGEIVDGYRRGLADPKPIVLERDHFWLRETLLIREKDRESLWEKLENEKWGSKRKPPPPYRAALAKVLPEKADFETAPRPGAGTGSLGRPRYVGRVRDWNGGPLFREAKKLVVSGWVLSYPSGSKEILTEPIARGAFRSPDPHYRVFDDLVVRRLSPNSRKIEVKEMSAGKLLAPRMLRAMGYDLANCHAGDARRIGAVRGDFHHRNGHWLCEAAKAAADAIAKEHADYKAATG